MPIPSPRTAVEASRLCRCTEAAAKLDVMLYSVRYGVEMESFKTDAEGQRTSRRYVVDMFKVTCTCPDFKEWGQFCKHLLYMEGLMRQAQEEEAAEQAADQEYGRLVMENHHIERSLAC